MKFFLRFIFKNILKVSVVNERDFSDIKNTIFVCNHQSTIDAFLIYAFCNSKMKFVMRKSLGDKKSFSFKEIINKTGFKNFLINRISCYLVKKIDVFRVEETSPHSLKEMINYLKSGNNIMVFPEGKITLDGNLSEIKDGMSFVSTITKSDILPMRIDGFDTSIFGYVNGKKKHKSLVFGLPFETNGLKRKEITKLIEDSIK